MLIFIIYIMNIFQIRSTTAMIHLTLPVRWLITLGITRQSESLVLIFTNIAVSVSTCIYLKSGENIFYRFICSIRLLVPNVIVVKVIPKDVSIEVCYRSLIFPQLFYWVSEWFGQFSFAKRLLLKALFVRKTIVVGILYNGMFLSFCYSLLGPFIVH